MKQLGILEVQYQHIFLNEDEIDWAQHFCADVDLFEKNTTMPASEVASVLTELDLGELRLIPPQQLISGKGHRLQCVHRRCNRLCDAVQETIIFAYHLSPLIVRLAEVGFTSLLSFNQLTFKQGLYSRRNFYSLIPILQALRETSFDESTLPDMFLLINSDQNYSCYKKTFEEAPSIPFLPPYIRQLRHCQGKELSQV